LCGELQFRRQHPFGDYILDFVCLENKLVIEVDGSQHGQQAEYDENRTQKLQAAGFRVLRFWNNEVLNEKESVRQKIWLMTEELQSLPLPTSPLPPARKGLWPGGKGEKELRKFFLESRGSKVSVYAPRGEVR
jgi:hypothetical protein